MRTLNLFLLVFFFAFIFEIIMGCASHNGGSSSSQPWVGVKQLGQASTHTYAYAVTTDSSGNVYTVGQTFAGLNGNTLIGNSDSFVSKYDSSGSLVWLEEFCPSYPSNTNSIASAVVVDSSQNVYVGGSSDDGPSGPLFVSKFASNGTQVWSVQMAGGEVNAMAVDASGNIFVAGDTGQGIDGNTLSAASADDFFVGKYNSSGTLLWLTEIGTGVSEGSSPAFGVGVDSSDNVYFSGWTTSALPGASQTGNYDYFLGRLSTTGSLNWIHQGGVSGKDTAANCLAVDSSSNGIYIAGNTSGGLNGGSLTGAGDYFLVRYDTSGALDWTRQLGSPSKSSVAMGVAVDSLGHIDLGGYTTGSLDNKTQTGNEDVFVAQYSSSGALNWVSQLGATSKNSYANGVAVDSSNNVFATGYSNGGLDGNSLTGLDDYFIAKYNSSGVLQ